MGKKANFHANFLDLTTIENKITGFCECNKVYVSIYSSFKSFIKCFIVQTTKILPQIIDSIKFCPQISGSKWENIYPWSRLEILVYFWVKIMIFLFSLNLFQPKNGCHY